MTLSHTGVDTLGDDQHEASGWFSDFGVSVLHDAELNRQGTGVAAVSNAAGDSLRVYRVTGAPVEGNPPQGCLTAPSRGSAYESPSWAPDGTRLAWSDASGIYVADPRGLADGCTGADSGAGTLSATARKGSRVVARAAARRVRAGTTTLTLKPTKAGRRTHGRVTVRVRFGTREAVLSLRIP